MLKCSPIAELKPRSAAETLLSSPNLHFAKYSDSRALSLLRLQALIYPLQRLIYPVRFQLLSSSRVQNPKRCKVFQIFNFFIQLN